MMSRSATPAPSPPSSQTSNTIQEVKEAPTKILGTRNETKVCTKFGSVVLGKHY